MNRKLTRCSLLLLPLGLWLVIGCGDHDKTTAFTTTTSASTTGSSPPLTPIPNGSAPTPIIVNPSSGIKEPIIAIEPPIVYLDSNFKSSVLVHVDAEGDYSSWKIQLQVVPGQAYSSGAAQTTLPQISGITPDHFTLNATTYTDTSGVLHNGATATLSIALTGNTAKQIYFVIGTATNTSTGEYRFLRPAVIDVRGAAQATGGGTGDLTSGGTGGEGGPTGGLSGGHSGGHNGGHSGGGG